MKSFFWTSFPFCPDILSFYQAVCPRSSIVLYSGNQRGRYSYVMVEPWYYKYSPHSFDDIEQIFLQGYIQKNINSIDGWNIPFIGGIAGMIPYEETSAAVIGGYDRFFVEDTYEKKCFLAGWFNTQCQADEWFAQYQQYSYLPSIAKDVSLVAPFIPQWSIAQYTDKFLQCQHEIIAGNSFQINLSQKFTAQTVSDAWDIFIMATQKNPASMMAFWEDADREQAVISCSPERLFSLDANGTLLTQPIGGTRKRGKTPEEESVLENDLQHSIKENAEHAMLVDLLRNDFGKVARFGSVCVADFARIEKYTSVMHLVSDISGVLSDNKTVFDLLKAMFPGGTITGTPKRETMKILHTQEQEPRAMYCGSAFYCSYSGHADFSIMIRTLQKNRNMLWGRAGGGVVVGADPLLEYQESRHKFAGLEKIFTI